LGIQALPLSTSQFVILRGFAFFETTAVMNFYSHYTTTAAAVNEQFSLVTTSEMCENSSIYDVQRTNRQPDVPIYFKIRISVGCSKAYLKAGSSPKLISLSGFMREEMDENIISEPALYHILSPPFGINFNDFQQLLVHFVEHHLNQGLTKSIVYMRDDHLLSQLVGQPMEASMEKLLVAQKIAFVNWNVFALPENQVLARYFDQQLVYNHAILSFSGTNSYLYIADLDDYIVTKTGTILDQLGPDCSMYQMERFDAYPNIDSCHVIRELGFSSGIQAINRCSLGLDIYSTIDDKKHLREKSIVYPDETWGFLVHSGFVYLPERNCAGGNEMYVLHLQNLLRLRDTKVH
jgi:hypothetical protein